MFGGNTNGSSTGSVPGCLNGDLNSAFNDRGDGSGFRADLSEGQRLYDAYFMERGIPLDKARFVAELLTPRQTKEVTGFRVWSIKFLYFNPSGTRLEDFVRIRFLQIRKKAEPKDGRPDFRYWQAKGSKPQQYLPPFASWSDIFDDTEQTFSWTEGEAKAIALTLAGRPCIGNSGVWSHSDRKNGKPLLDGFDAISLKGRRVEVVYDADIRNKPEVRAAQDSLMWELSNRGAEPAAVDLPGPEKGVDDFLKVHGIEPYDALLRRPFAIVRGLLDYNKQYTMIDHPPAICVKETGTLQNLAKLKDTLRADRALVTGRDGKIRDRLRMDVWLEWGIPRTPQTSRLRTRSVSRPQ